MKKFVSVIALVLMHGISTSALAVGDRTELSGACVYPEKPAIVDGKSATEAQMINSQKEMKEYLALGNEFLTCLEKEEGELTAQAAEENKARINTTYNTVVDDMNTVAESFNTALRAYKAQNQ